MDLQSQGVPKQHPASREILPEDPMEMRGFEVPGDPDLMLRLIVEEYARMGWDVNMIMSLARDPNYRAFYGLREMHGDEALRDRIADVIRRCGVIRVKTEQQQVPDQLVQIDVSTK